jgi:hypothetical protein
MPNNQPPNDDNSLPDQTRPGGILHKYKELIVTTIICLFLTGIYDSVNKQTDEIRKWYELMVNIQADMKIRDVDLETMQLNLKEHTDKAGVTFGDHERRIRDLEYLLGRPEDRRGSP